MPALPMRHDDCQHHGPNVPARPVKVRRRWREAGPSMARRRAGDGSMRISSGAVQCRAGSKSRQGRHHADEGTGPIASS
jgi:hypothetical protein